MHRRNLLFVPDYSNEMKDKSNNSIVTLFHELEDKYNLILLNIDFDLFSQARMLENNIDKDHVENFFEDTYDIDPNTYHVLNQVDLELPAEYRIIEINEHWNVLRDDGTMIYRGYYDDNHGVNYRIDEFDSSGTKLTKTSLFSDRGIKVAEILVNSEGLFDINYINYDGKVLFTKNNALDWEKEIFEGNHLLNLKNQWILDKVSEFDDNLIIAEISNHTSPVLHDLSNKVIYIVQKNVLNNLDEIAIEGLNRSNGIIVNDEDTLYQIKQKLNDGIDVIFLPEKEPNIISGTFMKYSDDYIGINFDDISNQTRMNIVNVMKDNIFKNEKLKIEFFSLKNAAENEFKGLISRVEEEGYSKEELENIRKKITFKFFANYSAMEKSFNKYKIYIDLGKKDANIARLLALHNGTPQITAVKRKYVTDRGNGYKIENESHLCEAVNYFLGNLANLNKSIYFSNNEIKKIFDPLYKLIDKNYPLENIK
ncbi:accessory secretory protein Asp1 [Weissella koreensis KACC 15510]|uniref:accessory Sec system glycosyltransferase Asp1 n=1 Tax=Weissella koreensis TaxID=165096 RepID=UPI0002175C05|nr:accessory Sec system glycosyltransferase Asp1 [Weissella koreensis]AEJ24195.1 accessory secretory protein Asp1 [Weissella koreensis KACC 15510]